MHACWEDCLKIIYGEAESVDFGETVCGFNFARDVRKYPSASDDERQEAYRVILTHNMGNVEPECSLYHYVSMPHFVKAIKASAFFLARPYTWSKSDDPAFNVAIKTGVLDGITLSTLQRKFLEAYMLGCTESFLQKD